MGDAVIGLDLIARSRAENSGYLALYDIAQLIAEHALEYRIVGGHMVTLHVAAAGVVDPTVRETLDADMGVPQQVAGDPALVSGLIGLGYDRPDSSNRFVRRTDQGHRLVIDLLAPAFGTELNTSQQHGEMYIDEIPGLALALARPATELDLHVQLLDGTHLDMQLLIPEIQPALCMKLMGWGSRKAAKDALDVWRLLRCYRKVTPDATAWPTTASLGDAAIRLRADFAAPNGTGMKSATRDTREQAEIRALALWALYGTKT